MARCKISRKTRQNLKDIYQYIFARNPTAADKLYQLFHDKFRMLADNPLLGEKREDLAENLRMFTADNYVILYQSTINGIEIVQIVHSARDLPALWSAHRRLPR
jgi:toxin ParE1/3/4